MTITYVCVSCGCALATDKPVYSCPQCVDEPAESPAEKRFRRGNLLPQLDPRKRHERGELIDPLSLLPLPIEGYSRFPAGNTPLLTPERLREKYGYGKLFIKNDSSNPSGSLKDRASLLVAAQAIHSGERKVVLASTGNAGSAMACAGAAFGLDVVLFVPKDAPKAKLVQSIAYGASMVPVDGSYDDAFTLSIEFTGAYGGINRNTAYNPLTVEGKKTAAVEIYNQLGGTVPDVVYIPTGDGVIFAGVWKGFHDLVLSGAADRIPMLVMAQAEGSNAFYRSLQENREVVLDKTETYADSIAVKSPAAGELALRCVRETGGKAVSVSDGEIRRAQAELCSEAGVFVEPSSAAAWSAAVKDSPNIDPAWTTVVLLTGTGFKDFAAAEDLADLPPPCAPDLDSVRRYLQLDADRT